MSGRALSTIVNDKLHPPGPFKKWPWFLIGWGIVLFGFYFGWKPHGEFPYLVHEDAAIAAAGSLYPLIGGALFVFGILTMVPLPIRDRDADPPFPTRPRPERAPYPVLELLGPEAVDEGTLNQALTRFGTDWPKVEIRWPRSTKVMFDQLDDLSKNQHKLDLGASEARQLNATLRQALRHVGDERERSATILPNMLRRCAGADHEQLIRLIRNFLLLSNYRSHGSLFEHLQRAQKLIPSLKMPKTWQHLTDLQPLDIQVRLISPYGFDDITEIGELYSIGDRKLQHRSGRPMGILSPDITNSQHMIPGRRTLETFVPQLELEADQTDLLPPRYDEAWTFRSWRALHVPQNIPPGYEPFRQYEVGSDDGPDVDDRSRRLAQEGSG